MVDTRNCSVVTMCVCSDKGAPCLDVARFQFKLHESVLGLCEKHAKQFQASLKEIGIPIVLPGFEYPGNRITLVRL